MVEIAILSRTAEGQPHSKSRIDGSLLVIPHVPNPVTESGEKRENLASDVTTQANEDRDRGNLLTLAGRCTVTYDGRTSRRFGPADRLVLCKPDGAVVVHEATGLQPVAYAQPGGTVEVVESDDGVVVRAKSDDPPESLVVAFDGVPQVETLRIETTETEGTGPEERLRGRLLDEPDLLEPGFRPLATERETPAGPVDVFGRDAQGRSVIVEVKARRVGPEAVGQLGRYVEAVERDLHADATVRGVLVAPGVTGRGREVLAEQGLEFVPMRP